MTVLAVTLLSLLSVSFAQAEEPDAVIVVTALSNGAPRGELAVAVEVIDSEHIAQSGAQTVADLLAAQPGVDVQRGRFGSEVRLRGMEADQTLVLIDGVRILGSKDGVVDLSRLPVENIDRIEVVKGPASAMHGSDALGGVIHIITRMPEQPLGGTGRLQLGSRNSLDANTTLSMRREKWGLTLSGGIHAGDPWDLDTNDAATSGSKWRQAEAAGRLLLEPRPEVAVTIDASTQLRDLDGIDVAIGGAVLERKNRAEDHRGGVNVRWLLSGRTKLSMSLRGAVYRDQYLVDQLGGDALDTYEDTIETTTASVVRFDHSLGGGHALAVGIDGEWRILNATRLDEGRGDRRRGAVFAQDRWSVPNIPLVLTPGVRFEADEWFGNAFAPKFAARLDPREDVVIRASVGQGYRAPSLRELLLRFENPGQGYVVVGNPDLEPERSTTADTGVEVKVADTWLSASAFHTEATNLIAIDTIDPGLNNQGVRFGYSNIGRARLSGIELGVSGSLTPELSLSLAYTGLMTRDLTRKGPLPGRSAHRLSGTINAGDIERVLFVFRGALTSRRPYYASEDSTDLLWGKPIAMVDMRVTGAIGSHLHWFAGIENMLDSGDSLTDPLPPRRFVAGADVRFGAKKQETP